jgi:hypothetical protein
MQHKNVKKAGFYRPRNHAAWETIREVYAKEVDGDVGMPAMICAVQTFGDLRNYHPHIHAVAPEGVFTESGYFVHIPYVCRLRAVEIWQEKGCQLRFCFVTSSGFQPFLAYNLLRGCISR